MKKFVLYFLAFSTSAIQLTTANSHGFEREDLLLSLDETNFCSSLLLSKEMKISLQKLSEIYTKEKELGANSELDNCCRSHYKCAHWKFETNQTNDPHNWSCECESKFRSCLKNVNTPLSSELGFGRSLYIKQCVALDFPINQCEIYEEFLQPNRDIQGSPNAGDFDSNTVRCLHYSLQENQPMKFQFFDLPFNYNGFTPAEMEKLRRNHRIKKLLNTVHGFTEDLHSFVRDIRSFHRKYHI